MSKPVMRIAGVVAMLATLAACGGGGQQGGNATGSTGTALVRMDGSSTVFPIAEAVAEEFQREHANVRVTVGISGTGGGFQKFCRNEVDVANASRPIKPSEREQCGKNGVEFIEIPIAYDGLVVAVHPSNTWAEQMTIADLKKIWAPEAQGKVRRWNQVRTGWPDRELHLFGPGVDSGTYDYFTEAVVGKEGASRGDFTSSEDDNVLVQGIATDETALGFFGIAYYEQNKGRLKAVAIDDGKDDNGKGAITATIQTVKDGTYQPLSRPLFLYVARKAADRPEVAQLVEYSLKAGPELVAEVGYVPLGSEGYALAGAHFAGRITGSAFEGGGSQVGMTIEQLLAREKR